MVALCFYDILLFIFNQKTVFFANHYFKMKLTGKDYTKRRIYTGPDSKQ